MIFNIVGINDQRILTALQRLLNAFNKSYKISALQYDYLITIIATVLSYFCFIT